MSIEDVIRGVKENLELANLSSEDKSKIFTEISSIAETEKNYLYYWRVIILLSHKASNINSIKYLSDNSWVRKAFEIVSCHGCKDNIVKTIYWAINEAYTTCERDNGEFAHYFEKTIDTLELYKDNLSIGQISNFIGDEASKIDHVENPKYFGLKLDVLSKPEFVECFSRPWHSNDSDTRIYKKILKDLDIVINFFNRIYYNRDLLEVLTSKEIDAVINDENVPELGSVVNTILKFHPVNVEKLKGYVELVHEHLPFAEGRSKFFYFIASSAVDSVRENYEHVKLENTFKIATNEEILAEVDHFGNEEKNESIINSIVGVISNFPEFGLARNFVQLAKDYKGKENCGDIIAMIHQVSDRSSEAKHVRKVCDLMRYYLNVAGSSVASNAISNSSNSWADFTLFGDEDNVGLIETTCDGLMKFEKGINNDFLEKTIMGLSGTVTSPEVVGLMLEALALYHNDPDSDKLIPVCQSVDGESYDALGSLKDQVKDVVCGIVLNSFDGTDSLEQIAKCLTLYHGHKKRNKVLSHVYNKSVVGRYTQERARVLRHPAIVEEVDKYLGNEKLLQLLERVEDFDKMSGDNLRDLRNHFSRRKKDYEKNIDLMQEYYHKFYFKISDRELANNISVPEIEQMFIAYDIVDNTCSGWQSRYRLPARDAFFDVLNDKVSSGKTLKEKRNILRQWCYNVPRQIQDNIADLMFAQPTAEYTNPQLGVNVA